ncbi:MAG: HepT-like ribonuclease domain-containing protein [Steroidobacteraceae bacterium]
MTKPWEPYARHIIDTIEKLRRIEARGDLTQDEILYDAALRNLQTLSEATQSLPQPLKDRHPNIPWKQISGFRNILVHNYLGNIDPLTVASVIKQHLAPLKLAIEAILRESVSDQT